MTAPTVDTPTVTRLELRHVEHLMDVCGDSHDGLMLLGTMAVVANVIKQRDEAESQLLAARREVEALRREVSTLRGAMEIARSGLGLSEFDLEGRVNGTITVLARALAESRERTYTPAAAATQETR